MNTFQLECFLAVANTLSFARAAEELNVSQPTVTHQIKSLEDELNAKLFIRSTRMVEITPEGQSFITDAKSMIMIAKQAKLRFASSDERPMETLSIGCGSYLQLILISEILHELNSQITNFHPRLYVLPREQLFHLLETERLDVILDIQESSELKGNMKYKELSQNNIVCVCRKDHKLAEKEYATLDELMNESLIFCDPMNIAPDIANLQMMLIEGRSPADIHFCTSPEAAVVLASSGVGVAFLPEIYISNEYIAKVPLENTPKLSFGMFYKPYVGDTLLKQFIQTAKEYFEAKEKAE